MRKQILIIAFLIIKWPMLQAQQWAGSKNNSGPIYRDGNVLVGGSSFLGTFRGNERIVQIQGTGSWLSFVSSSSASSLNIGYSPLFETTGIYANQLPLTLWTNMAERLRINTNGTIGIGIADTKGYKLAVNGPAIFTKVVVKPYSNWPDYVFEKNYPLLSLDSVENFIKENKHLPNVPGAYEIGRNGIDLGENQKLLLEKTEELTLYIIRQNKIINQQDIQIESLESKISSLELRLQLLENKLNQK